MHKDRTLRRLTALEKSASTSRVLNLLHTHRQFGASGELAAAPLFQNPILDRCIIVKHRLRPHEYGDFDTPRTTATKLMLPIDFDDLKAGARTVFVGQRDFDALVSSTIGDVLGPGSRDRDVLEIMDTLPSLDPFLLREQLRKVGIHPATAYFNITDGDVMRMFEFARQELSALVAMSGGSSDAVRRQGARLVEKLLSSSPDTSFIPLKETLRLSDSEYLDGIYAWRGFLYYKWVLSDLQRPVPDILSELLSTEPLGRTPSDMRRRIDGVRARIQTSIVGVLEQTTKSIEIYDKAYMALTRDGKPAVFSDFLLAAPDRFFKLGEELGMLQHIVSFWRYRFPANRPRLIDAEDLFDILLDFELGLGNSAIPKAA